MGVFGLFRKKARAEEVGAYLTDFVVKPLNHYRENYEDWLGEGQDGDVVLKELFILQAFAVEYSLSLFLRDGPVRERALNSFRNYLDRQKNLPFREDPIRNLYEARVADYRRAIASSSSNPTAGVGTLFASCCEACDAERISEQAAVEFASTVTAVTRFLMRLKVR